MAKVERTHNYNGEPLKPGEVLVLTPFNEDDFKTNCTNKENIVTVRVAGRSFKAILKAVPAEFEAVAKSQFNSWVNSQLPPRRDGRCMIPQPDGTTTECPRRQGNNHPTCKTCPHRNEYKRKDKNVVSVESLEDEYGYTAATVPSLEDEHLKIENQTEAQRLFLRKVQQLIEISPKHALALLLKAQGIKGAVYAAELQLGHTAASKVREQIMDLAPSRIDDIGQIDVEGLKANKSKLTNYYRQKAYQILDIVLEMYFIC